MPKGFVKKLHDENLKQNQINIDKDVTDIIKEFETSEKLTFGDKLLKLFKLI